jgi:hypothetical protein
MAGATLRPLLETNRQFRFRSHGFDEENASHRHIRKQYSKRLADTER